MDDKVLPIKSLGTGVEEIVMIAAFCTINNESIVCIEEPETHLHPILQRKLIRYLSKKTSNQYFIATHFAAFIDSPNAQIFHVRNDGIQVYVHPARLSHEKLAICRQLGYRAPDILQANSVIWVEGPSDRIYVNHWLRSVRPELKEGIHYSVMFYGGRLLNHLSAQDREVSDFIGLRSLNQNLAVIIDSDKRKPQSSINPTKMRIRDELLHTDGFVWVTEGREIENYAEPKILQAALQKMHPTTFGSAIAAGAYDNALQFKRRKKKSSSLIETGIDKVKLARLVAEEPAELRVLDLEDRINDLVNFIRKANQE